MASVIFNSNARAIKKEIESRKQVALEVVGGMAESYASLLCPVDTGNLRSSITHRQVDDDTEAIGSAVEYAPYVELGTVKMRAQPFLRPAAENHGNEYGKVIESIMKR